MRGTVESCSHNDRRIYSLHACYYIVWYCVLRYCTARQRRVAARHLYAANEEERSQDRLGGAPAGTLTRQQIEETYNISTRIEAEEQCLDTAMLVFTSTQQEIDGQWNLYDG